MKTLKPFVAVCLFVIALLVGYASTVQAQVCDKNAPDYWERIEFVDPDGTEHWLCSCGDTWVVPVEPLPTVAVTATPVVVQPTPEPTTVITDIVVLPTPEPTDVYTDIVVLPTPTVVVPTPTPEPTKLATMPTPAVISTTVQEVTILPPTTTVVVSSTVQEVAPGLTNVTTRTWVVENTTVVEVTHPTFTEVYSITAEGKVTRDVRDSVVMLTPVTGGEATIVDQLVWLVEDIGDLAIAWLLAALLLVVFVIASIVCAVKRIINR